MCLVIDANCLHKVFPVANASNAQFAPVRSWIMRRAGKVICGGTKYDDELGRVGRVLGLLAELSKAGKVVRMPAPVVDKIAADLKGRLDKPSFNDEHIAALVIASRCRVVCTSDKAAHGFLKCREAFAPYGIKRPRIYNGHASHTKLCCDKNVVAACLKPPPSQAEVGVRGRVRRAATTPCGAAAR